MWANCLRLQSESVDESYFQPFGHAVRFATSPVIPAVVCWVHGLLPFVFDRTGVQLMGQLHNRVVLNRRRSDARREGVTGSAGTHSASRQ